MGRPSWAHDQVGGVAPKLDTASHFPLLLPEAVGAGRARRPYCERSVSGAWAASAAAAHSMAEVAIVKEGWLHKRGQCLWGRPGAGAPELAHRLPSGGRCFGGLLDGRGLPGAPRPAQVSLQGPVSPTVCRAWPCRSPGWGHEARGPARSLSGWRWSDRLAGPGWQGELLPPPSPLSWKAARTLGLVQGRAHWRPRALPEGS